MSRSLEKVNSPFFRSSYLLAALHLGEDPISSSSLHKYTNWCWNCSDLAQTVRLLKFPVGWFTVISRKQHLKAEHHGPLDLQSCWFLFHDAPWPLGIGFVLLMTHFRLGTSKKGYFCNITSCGFLLKETVAKRSFWMKDGIYTYL